MQESSRSKEITPLHNARFKITNDLKKLSIRTGDILFRLGCESYYCLPFSKLVARVTNSKYSHASIVLIEESNIYCLEVNENGTQKYLLQDWVDFSQENGIALYRATYLSQNDIQALKLEIQRFFDLDPDYDFTFTSQTDELTYCTASVAKIYKYAGIDIFKPELMKDVLHPFVYSLVLLGNTLFKMVNASLPTDTPLYFVGNEEKGMLASKRIQKIYEYV